MVQAGVKVFGVKLNGSAVVRFRQFILLISGFNVGKVNQGENVVRGDLQGRSKAVFGFRDLSSGQAGLSEQRQRFAAVGQGPYGFAGMKLCRRIIVPGKKNAGEFKVDQWFFGELFLQRLQLRKGGLRGKQNFAQLCFRITGIDFQGPVIGFFGFCGLMQLLPDVADLQPGFFEAAVEFCGTRKSLKGFVGFIPAVERNAEVEMERGPAAVGFYGAVEQPGAAS